MFTFFQGSSTMIIPSDANALGQNDYGVGAGGVSQTIALINNTFTTLGNVAQSGDGASPNGAMYIKAIGLIGSGSNAILTPAPAITEGIILPNQNPGILRAFDQAPYSQEAIGYFALGDIDNIANYQYIPSGTDAGIRIYFTNRITESDIVVPNWFQFASLNAADMTINTDTWANGPYYTQHSLLGGTVLNANASSGASGIIAASASNINVGQFLKIGDGVSAEVVWVTGITGTIISIHPSLINNHVIGESVYACAEGFAIKMKVPGTGISEGTPKDWFNCSLDCSYQYKLRP